MVKTYSCYRYIFDEVDRRAFCKIPSYAGKLVERKTCSKLYALNDWQMYVSELGMDMDAMLYHHIPNIPISWHHL